MSRKVAIRLRHCVATVCALVLVGCGVGKFFIERAITGMQDSISGEIYEYADFTPAQKLQIDELALNISNWVKRDRLPAMVLRLELMAKDIQNNAKLSEATWSNTMRFLESPMRLSEVPGAVDSVALLIHGLSAVQVEDVLEKMSKDQQEAISEYEEFDFDEQNKEFAKGLKTIFSELGVTRSKAQIKRARTMLGERQTHRKIEWQARQTSHNAFVSLVANTKVDEAVFVDQFQRTWKKSERGVKELAPRAWEHNSQVTYRVLNYLLADLSEQERETAANNIREYSELFTRLSL